jgi:hypothetical protein
MYGTSKVMSKWPAIELKSTELGTQLTERTAETIERDHLIDGTLGIGRH